MKAEVTPLLFTTANFMPSKEQAHSSDSEVCTDRVYVSLVITLVSWGRILCS